MTFTHALNAKPKAITSRPRPSVKRVRDECNARWGRYPDLEKSRSPVKQARPRQAPSNGARYIVGFLLGVLLMLVVSTPAAAQQPDSDQQTTPPTPPTTSNPVHPMRAMMLTSRAARAAVEKIRPSLVTIESFGGVSAVQGRIGGIRKRGEGNTTGILVTREGHIITSTFNFISQPPVITVMTADGKRHVVKMLGRDDIRKLTMLKIESDRPFPVPEMVPTDELEVGQWAVSVGVGYGDTTPAISIGIISALNRIGGRAVQTDANISPANYGGPLIDLRGRVIGVCVPLNPQSDSLAAGVEWYDSGIGFAVPLQQGDEWIEMLKAGRRVAPGFLGVLAIPNPEGPGLFLERVIQDSPAGKAGLLREDIVLNVDDQTTDDVRSLRNILARKMAGSTINIRYIEFATGQEKTVEVELADPPQLDQPGPPGSRPPR